MKTHIFDAFSTMVYTKMIEKADKTEAFENGFEKKLPFLCGQVKTEAFESGAEQSVIYHRFHFSVCFRAFYFGQ